MRLTLRTMLAYLDGILEPNDAQEIGKKVEESEFASGLVHRIRDVMRRLRLGAPGPTDHSTKADPNTAAEYLDNTLASESVTDYEKVCLESDVHLAEVASCHQILTLVLGEPAEIDPASRQRMYELNEPAVGIAPPAPIVRATPAAESVGEPPSLDLGKGDGESAERKARPRPTVPEYLREPHKGRRWLPAAAVLLAACFTMVVLMDLGQFEPRTPLGDLLVRWGVVASPPELAADTEEAAERAGDEGQGAREAQQESSRSQTPDRPPPVQPIATPAEEPPHPTQDAVGVPVRLPPLQPKETPIEPVKEPPKRQDTELVVKPEIPPKPDIALEPEIDPAKPTTKSVEAPAVQPPRVAVAEPRSASKPDGESGAATGSASIQVREAKPAAEPAPAVEPAPLPPPEPLGRLVSSDQALLHDDGAGGWVRVAANQMLAPGRLLALPTYRAKVALLSVGATLEILGGTQVELLASGPQELPGVRVLYGRVTMMPPAKAGSRLRVTFGGRSGVIAFADAESLAALEVRRILTPGANPEAEPPYVAATLYASTGGVSWNEPGDKGELKTLQLAPAQWVSFHGPLSSAPAVSKELPKWIVADSISPLDRRASPQIAQALPTGRLARLGLMELCTSRTQKEVKWLAMRCLGYIGQFQDMVAALNDPARKADWSDFYIEQLREAVARDSKSAEAVRFALEKQYPEQAADLYRMLWGYTDKDLEAGADADLVKALDDDTLAVRVLSSWNLKELTGAGGQYYYPEQTAAKRQQPTRRWRQLLEAKKIRLKTPEEKAGAAEETAVPPAAESGK